MTSVIRYFRNRCRKLKWFNFSATLPKRLNYNCVAGRTWNTRIFITRAGIAMKFDQLSWQREKKLARTCNPSLRLHVRSFFFLAPATEQIKLHCIVSSYVRNHRQTREWIGNAGLILLMLHPWLDMFRFALESFNFILDVYSKTLYLHSLNKNDNVYATTDL